MPAVEKSTDATFDLSSAANANALVDVLPHSRVFDRFCLLPRRADPRTHTPSSRWLITILLAAAAMVDSLTTNILYPCLVAISTDLHTKPAVANLAIALPIVSTAIVPIYWSSASERFGRRDVYIVSLSLAVILTALCAIASSTAMLVVMRTLAAAASSAVTPLGAAVISDVWETNNRGHGMSILFIGILCGPTLGPVFGGLLTQRWGWRSTQWFMTVYTALILMLIVLLLPNTLILSTDHGDSPKERPQNTLFRKFVSVVILPLKVVYYLANPAVTLTISLASTTYLVLKGLEISVQEAFSASPYRFSALIVGVAYLPFSAGLVVGNLVGGSWSDYVMNRRAKAAERIDEQGELVHTPEDRLGENAWVAVVLFPGALLWWGWSVSQGNFWVVPMIGLFFCGLSGGALFGLVFTVLVELLPERSASLTALDGLGENVCAAIGSVIAQPIISAAGNGWLFTIFAVVSVSNALAVFLLRRYGAKWRSKLTADG